MIKMYSVYKSKRKCWNNLNEHIEALEEKAKINGIDIEGSDER